MERLRSEAAAAQREHADALRRAADAAVRDTEVGALPADGARAGSLTAARYGPNAIGGGLQAASPRSCLA